MQQKRRRKLKAQGGSIEYTQRPSLSAGGEYLFAPSRSDPEGRVLKLGGFDKIRIANKSNVDVELRPNDDEDRSLFIESGTQEIFTDILPFRSYKIVNLDGSTGINTGELTVTVKLSQLTADDAAMYNAENPDNNGRLQNALGLINLLG